MCVKYCNSALGYSPNGAHINSHSWNSTNEWATRISVAVHLGFFFPSFVNVFVRLLSGVTTENCTIGHLENTVGV